MTGHDWTGTPNATGSGTARVAGQTVNGLLWNTLDGPGSREARGQSWVAGSGFSGGPDGHRIAGNRSRPDGHRVARNTGRQRRLPDDRRAAETRETPADSIDCQTAAARPKRAKHRPTATAAGRSSSGRIARNTGRQHRLPDERRAAETRTTPADGMAARDAPFLVAGAGAVGVAVRRRVRGGGGCSGE